MCAKIVQLTISKAEQTKSQKEFNRLVQKIETLEKSITDYRTTMTKLQQRAATELVPLRKQYFEQRVQLVRRFDRAYASAFYKKNEKIKLAYLIQDITFELIEVAGMEELKPIHDKYSHEGNYDDILKETDRLRNPISVVGADSEDEFGGIDPEDIQQRSYQKTTDRQHTPRPKTQKQLDREAKKELEIRTGTKAVRTVYLDLVKAFHPDRETDEAEKAQKTEIMQRVTQAYEKNDLMALLRLQLEFERIDQSHIESLAENHLNYYNKKLREQTKELEREYEELQLQAQAVSGQVSYIISTPIGLEFVFNQQISEYKKTVKHLKKDLKDLQNDETVRAFLKSYTIPKNDGF